jgi:glycine/D-amino acid oxidase-like deaminating enzyme
MGMFTLNHLEVHLHHSLLRQRGGLRVPNIIVSEEAPFVGEIPAEYASLYSVVPSANVRAVLGTTDDRYNAVMSDHKGCGNSALLIEQVLEHLEATFADRFRFVDHTEVSRIVLDATNATIFAGEHRVDTQKVVMCTNGFVDHVIENRVGSEIAATMHHRVAGTVGYMTGFVDTSPADANAFSFIRNEVIGESTPYVYLTRRPYEHPTNPGTLSCMGGPEVILDDQAAYDPGADFPTAVLKEFDTEILPIVQSARSSGLAYDYAWHGLMGYNDSRVRLIGFEPRNPVLMYNLGCNGVGFMPSIYGGFRIGRLLCGDQLESSIFDPP